MLFTASTLFANVTKIKNTDYIVGEITTFTFPTTQGFAIGHSVNGTGDFVTANGVVFDMTSHTLKVAKTSELGFSTTHTALTNGDITASYSSFTVTLGVVNIALQSLFDRDAWLRENAGILSENETVTGLWTLNSATVTTLRGTTASFSGTSTLSTLRTNSATITTLHGTTGSISNIRSNSATITTLKGTTANIDNILASVATLTALDIANIKISNLSIHTNTSDGADNSIIQINGGGAGGTSRGADIVLFGNESSSGNGGNLLLSSGSVSNSLINIRNGAKDQIQIGTAGITFSDTRVTIPNLNVTSVATFATLNSSAFFCDFVKIDYNHITSVTNDNADNLFLGLCGGGGYGFNRGAVIELYGNEAGSGGGNLNLWTGQKTDATIRFMQNGAQKLIIGPELATFSTQLTAHSFNATSKREYKENIVEVTISALDLIDTVDVVNFNFKDSLDDNRIGFIADDTDELLSGLNKDKMDIGNCIGVLFKAVQELREENRQLKIKLGVN